MCKYDALFEDEDDIFQGTPRSRYWAIHNQTSVDLREDEFDLLVERIAAMEMMLSENYDYDTLELQMFQIFQKNYELFDQVIDQNQEMFMIKTKINFKF